MTRVLFLTESFHPVLGGGERHIRALGRDLVRTGMPATVVTRRGELSWPAEETLDGIRVVRVPPPGPGRSGKYGMVPHALAALFRLRRDYDALVVRGTRVLGLPGLVAGRALAKRVILQPELNGEMSGEVYTWGKAVAGTAVDRGVRAATAVRNLLLRDADAFVAMSTAIAGEFLDAGVAREKVWLIPHGVDTERFRPPTAGERGAARARWGIPPDAVVIAYTGRLLRGKGLEDLVEAFARVRAEVPSALLLVVGSGEGQSLSIEEDLRRSVQDRGLSARVVFTGRLEDVGEALRAADVFAFPSRFEALGLSLLEAAASGVPAVGARTGGIVDVIEDGASGYLYPPGEAAALAERIALLARDDSLRARLGARAREVARARFDERGALLKYRALFAEVAAAGRPAAAAAAR